jgi:hypothetical protein
VDAGVGVVTEESWPVVFMGGEAGGINYRLEDIPQRLKPFSIQDRYGTSELVPFQNQSARSVLKLDS